MPAETLKMVERSGRTRNQRWAMAAAGGLLALGGSTVLPGCAALERPGTEGAATLAPSPSETAAPAAPLPTTAAPVEAAPAPLPEPPVESVAPAPPPPPEPLRIGPGHDNIEEIMFLQTELREAGCFIGISGIDGEFPEGRSETLNGLKDYQNNVNLEVDGWAGPDTFANLATYIDTGKKFCGLNEAPPVAPRPTPHIIPPGCGPVLGPPIPGTVCPTRGSRGGGGNF